MQPHPPRPPSVPQHRRDGRLQPRHLPQVASPGNVYHRFTGVHPLGSNEIPAAPGLRQAAHLLLLAHPGPAGGGVRSAPPRAGTGVCGQPEAVEPAHPGLILQVASHVNCLHFASTDYIAGVPLHIRRQLVLLAKCSSRFRIESASLFWDVQRPFTHELRVPRTRMDQPAHGSQPHVQLGRGHLRGPPLKGGRVGGDLPSNVRQVVPERRQLVPQVPAIHQGSVQCSHLWIGEDGARVSSRLVRCAKQRIRPGTGWTSVPAHAVQIVGCNARLNSLLWQYSSFIVPPKSGGCTDMKD
mmetsp:Transcript_97013/g.259169  ORF Transcript_97013/g.259169 Transcript_97013/m.259169 type:complete len:297 (-) Transcript_97013:1059-1949(-)